MERPTPSESRHYVRPTGASTEAAGQLLEAPVVSIPSEAHFHPDALDVSRRTIPAFVEAMTKEGLSPQLLLVGTTLTPEDLGQTGGWISWNDYRIVTENTARHLGMQAFVGLGVSAFESAPFRLFRLVSWALPSPQAFYRWAVRMAYNEGGLFIRCMNALVSPLNESSFHVVFRLPEGARFPETFIVGMGATLAHLATLFGSKPAACTHRVEGPCLVYTLTLPHHESDQLLAGSSWMQHWKQWLFSSRYGAKELKQAYELLEARNRELTAQLTELRRSESERRRLEARLRQAEKLEAIGQFSSSVAHDFNSYLTIILGQTDLLLESPLSEQARSDVETIRAASTSASTLTTQLLAFSRQQELEIGPVSLNEVVSSMDAMLRSLVGGHVKLKITLDRSLGCVMADVGQTKQVLLNLVANARDAMESEGHLQIETRQLSETEQAPGASAGRYALLQVTDEGTGMDEKTRERVFEPFFTTKGADKGTGLGLATVHGIVHQLGGRITLDSEVGVGTTVSVYFPLEAS